MLLLNKTSLKKAGTVFNLKNVNIKMIHGNVHITTSNIGHYALNILPYETCSFDDTEEILIIKEGGTD